MDYKSWLDLFKNLSPILSGYSAGAANGLVNEANLTAQQNQGATSRYQALVNAGRLQNIEQPSANLDQGTRGSVLSSWQPVKVGSTSVPYGSNTNGPVRPSITGGPSVTPELRQLGSQVTSDALARQKAGNPASTDAFPSDEDLGMTAMPKASLLDKIIGYAGTGAGILGAIPGIGGAAKAGAALAPGAGVSAIGPNGIPLGGTQLPIETMPAEPSFLEKIFAFGGGGGAGGSNERSMLQDMAMRQQLNDFGIGPDAGFLNTPSNPDDRIPRSKRWMTRR